MWSNEVTSSSGGFDNGGPPTNLFNGKTTNPGVDASSAGATVTWNPVGGYANTGDIEVFTTNRARPFVLTYTDGTTASGNTTQDDWAVIGTGKGVTGITVGGEAGQYNNWTAIRINGKILKDSAGLDTVTDTPLKDYAVLDSGTNGNLATTQNTQAGTTSNLSVTGKVYAEALITLPSEEITVGLKNDAKTDVIMLANRVDFNEGDVVGIAVDVPGASVDWYVNGTFLRTNSIDTSGGIKIGGNSGNTGTNGSIIFNFGQQPFINTPPAGYEGLFQESINSSSSGGSGSSPSGSYASGRLYLVLDGSGNVTDMQVQDPGYIVLGNAKEYTITWPALLPSGESPDTELPEGTQICAYVKATNDSGFDEELTNHLTPS